VAHSTAAETLDKIIIVIIATIIVIIVVPVVSIADLCISVLVSDQAKDKFSNREMGYVESSFLSRHRT
jgi:hypothetical protein